LKILVRGNKIRSRKTSKYFSRKVMA